MRSVVIPFVLGGSLLTAGCTPPVLPPASATGNFHIAAAAPFRMTGGGYLQPFISDARITFSLVLFPTDPIQPGDPYRVRILDAATGQNFVSQSVDSVVLSASEGPPFVFDTVTAQGTLTSGAPYTLVARDGGNAGADFLSFTTTSFSFAGDVLGGNITLHQAP